MKPVLITGHTALLAVILGIAPLAPARAQSVDQAGFGRFFTTPQTRSELDNARANYTLDRPPPRATRRTEEQPRPEHIKFGGVVVRGDGSGATWINDAANPENTTVVQDVSLDASNAGQPLAVITLPGGNRVTLRPGEIYSLETGRIRDSFQQKSTADRESTESAEGEESEQDSDASEEAEAVEAFDESELADRDFRILLLEKRLEKLESSIAPKSKGQTQSDQSGSARD